MNSKETNNKISSLVAGLGLAYPIAAHVAVTRSAPSLIAASVGLLILIGLLPGLFARQPLAWALLVSISVGLYAAASHGYALLLLFLPPVLINTYVGWLFVRSLHKTRIPLIEQVIRALQPAGKNIEAPVTEYARSLTLFWAALLIGLSIINLLLALLANPGGILLAAGVTPPITVPLSVWSLFANVINYLIIAVVFAAEFQLRQRRFPDQPFDGFIDFLLKLSSIHHIFRRSGRDTT